METMGLGLATQSFTSWNLIGRFLQGLKRAAMAWRGHGLTTRKRLEDTSPHASVRRTLAASDYWLPERLWTLMLTFHTSCDIIHVELLQERYRCRQSSTFSRAPSI